MNILFVCTGNTCRSSMAEGIAKALVQGNEALKEKVNVASAGVAAYHGEPASANSVRALKELWGVDISGHTAKSVSGELVEWADLVLTMTREHKRYLLSMYPQYVNKIFTLKQYAKHSSSGQAEEYDYSLDIMDPYGMPLEAYKKSAEEISYGIKEILKRLSQGHSST